MFRGSTFHRITLWYCMRFFKVWSYFTIASILIPIQNFLDTKFPRLQYPSKLYSVYIFMNGKKEMTMPKAFSLPFINL